MTKEEVFILNRALDGAQIYGMPDFSLMHISELLIDSYKEGMIRRGLLEDKANLTMKGVDIVSRMKDYKEGLSYLSLNNLTIAKNESGNNVSLMYNPVLDEYKFTRITIPEDCSELIESYEFLNEAVERDEEEIGRFSQNELKDKFGENLGKTLEIKKQSKTERSSFTVFVKDNEAYLYNTRTGALAVVGKKKIADKIKEGLK